MKLVKTTIFSGITTFFRVAAGFVSTKIVAVLIGAAGVSVVGAFSNFLSIILAFGNCGINNGVIKYTAEFSDDYENYNKLVSTAMRVTVWSSASIGLTLICFSVPLSNIIFSDSSYYMIIIILGITLILYTLNLLIVSILNGRGQIQLLTKVNIVGSFIGLLITCIFVYYFKVMGALYGLILSQTLIFFVTLYLIRNQSWFRLKFALGQFDVPTFKKLSRFSLMALVSAITVPISQIILRNMLIDRLGIEDAGIWQGMMRISDGYLMVINMSLITYYLPKLSKINDIDILRREIFDGYKIIVPVMVLISVAVYLVRHWTINILYTPEFVTMESLFFWQLIGDVFKICSYILAYLMLAKAMTKMYIITEVVFSISYIILSHLFVEKFGLRGITIAFALNYLFYLIAFLFLFKRMLLRGVSYGET